MIRAALFALALSGCTFVEHTQVLPIIDRNNDVSCCAAYVEIPPDTRLTASVEKANEGFKVKLGASWRF